ncbi:translation initiation factor IF-2-like [Moschus berezovskii]|uniref:translation initiation factor IF-2-like n=1 Tax=Moschus berezovskii TaxID=68408 RepID=UPI002444C9DB|nr:translation initiation factor IF-2-like [Moschus berezovskii]
MDNFVGQNVSSFYCQSQENKKSEEGCLADDFRFLSELKENTAGKRVDFRSFHIGCLGRVGRVSLFDWLSASWALDQGRGELQGDCSGSCGSWEGWASVQTGAGGLRFPSGSEASKHSGIGPGLGALAGSASSSPRPLGGPSAADPRPSGRALVPGLRTDELACFLFVRPRRGGRRRPAPAAQPGRLARSQLPRPPARRSRPPAPAQPRRRRASRPGPQAAGLRAVWPATPQPRLPRPHGPRPRRSVGGAPRARRRGGHQVKSKLDSEICGRNNATAWPVLQKGHILSRLALATGGVAVVAFVCCPAKAGCPPPCLPAPQETPGRGRGPRLLDWRAWRDCWAAVWRPGPRGGPLSCFRPLFVVPEEAGPRRARAPSPPDWPAASRAGNQLGPAGASGPGRLRLFTPGPGIACGPHGELHPSSPRR